MSPSNGVRSKGTSTPRIAEAICAVDSCPTCERYPPRTRRRASSSTFAAARENLSVADKSLETSRELLRQTQAQLDVGVAPGSQAVKHGLPAAAIGWRFGRRNPQE